MERLGLLLRQLERGRHVAAVHRHGRRVLRRVLVLAVEQDDHGRGQADVHLEVLVAQLGLPRHVLALAHQELEHVLAGEQRHEQERHGDDAGGRVQRRDRQPQQQQHAKRAQERRHLLAPEGAERAAVLDAHAEAEQGEVGRLPRHRGDGPGDEQADGHLVQAGHPEGRAVRRRPRTPGRPRPRSSRRCRRPRSASSLAKRPTGRPADATPMAGRRPVNMIASRIGRLPALRVTRSDTSTDISSAMMARTAKTTRIADDRRRDREWAPGRGLRTRQRTRRTAPGPQ